MIQTAITGGGGGGHGGPEAFNIFSNLSRVCDLVGDGREPSAYCNHRTEQKYGSLCAQAEIYPRPVT